MLIVGILLLTPAVSAYSSYLSSFNSRYGTSGSSLDTCLLCHTTAAGGGARNAYGSAYGTYHDFSAIESLDSDGDGYSNLVEINARTFPGNPASHPSGTTTYTATPTPTSTYSWYTPTPTPTPTYTSTPTGGTGVGSSFSSAILLTGSTTGTVSAGGSVYYKFYASAGQSVTVNLKPDFSDLDLYVFDQSYSVIDSSSYIGFYPETVTFTASTAGYYFAKVIDYSGYVGTFTIQVSGSSTPTSTYTPYPTYTSYPTPTYTPYPTYTSYPTPTYTPSPTATTGATTGTVITIQSAGGSSSISGATNSVIPVSIVANNVQNLAAATVTLTYDPSVVTVQNVSSGGLGAPTSNINNNAGNTQITVFSTTGVSGNVAIAGLNLKVVGSTGATSPLTLSVSALSNANGNSIPYTISSGQLSVAQYLRGDMNCDGVVNIIDALLIAKYSVGLIPAPYTC